MRGSPFGLRLQQWFQQRQCRLRITGTAASGGKHQHCGRIVRDRVQDFECLLGSERRIDIEQARRMSQRNIDGADGVPGSAHCGNFRRSTAKENLFFTARPVMPCSKDNYSMPVSLYEQ
jgi:hypothetical protein